MVFEPTPVTTARAFDINSHSLRIHCRSVTMLQTNFGTLHQSLTVRKKKKTVTDAETKHFAAFGLCRFCLNNNE